MSHHLPSWFYNQLLTLNWRNNSLSKDMNVKTWVQTSRIQIKLKCGSKWVSNLSIPTGRWEGETGEYSEGQGSASLAHTTDKDSPSQTQLECKSHTHTWGIWYTHMVAHGSPPSCNHVCHTHVWYTYTPNKSKHYCQLKDKLSQKNVVIHF